MIKRNLFLFKIDNFLSGFWPLCAVAVIYFEQITHSYTQAMLVFSIINLTQSLCEVPTGIISDKIGRKKSMIITNFFIMLGYTMWALASVKYGDVLLYFGGLFVGCGKAFLSGTDDALVFETLKKLNKESEFDKVFSQNRSFDELGLAGAALLATFVYYFKNIEILAWLGIIPSFLRVILSCFYVEPNCVTRPTDAPLKHLLISINILKKSPKLLKFAIVKSFNDGFNAVNWRFIGAYYAELIAPWLINIVRIVQEIMGFISYRLVCFFHNYTKRKVLFLSILINSFIKLCGVIINTAITPFVMASSTLCYGISTTVENTLLQEQLTDRQRATMGSVISLFAGFLNFIIFILIGIIADIINPRISIFLIMIARITIAFAYRKVLK